MSNNSQQKTTFILISNHRLIRLQLQFKIRWHHQLLWSLQAAATVPVEKAPGIPWGINEMVVPSSDREQGSSDTAVSMIWKICKPQNLQHKAGASALWTEETWQILAVWNSYCSAWCKYITFKFSLRPLREKSPKLDFQMEWVLIRGINRQIMDLLNNIHTLLVISSKDKTTS